MVFQASGRRLTELVEEVFGVLLFMSRARAARRVVAASAPKRCRPTIKLKAVDTVQIVAFKTGSARFSVCGDSGQRHLTVAG